ncbi:hypothetical protein MJG53_002709 [Ovis ammon polii x Ovis aries]|uniref:Uncharacterized protein n=1 Tax=Ovis ammon polii x Ovis aries TaxID=2918886 RepID=A0ACB9VEA5_9CETA|nr:hypothetical protein MJG53_002709 [Ovis ammon polii x Ovis aries]
MYENLERVVAVSLAGGVHWKDQREAKPLISNTKPLIICGCEERDGEIHTLIPLYNLRQWNQVPQLLHKFVVIVGDAVQRAVYEDLVLPLQKDCLPSSSQLKTKGELSFEHHALLEGCRQEGLHRCTRYREMRPFCVGHHLVLVYFLAHPLRDGRDFPRSYQEDLQSQVGSLGQVLPKDCRLVWNMVMPGAEVVSRGFLLPEDRHPVLQMWCGVSKARVFAWLGLGGTQHSSHGKRSSQAAIGSLGCFRCLKVWYEGVTQEVNKTLNAPLPHSKVTLQSNQESLPSSYYIKDIKIMRPSLGSVEVEAERRSEIGDA